MTTSPVPAPQLGELGKLQAALEAQKWTFAKTMPENPHEYVVGDGWRGNDAGLGFMDAYLFIRRHGYVEWWPDIETGWAYVSLDVGGYHYWTMGGKRVLIINRKKLEEPCPSSSPDTF